MVSNKLFAMIFAAIGAFALVAAFFMGAWWHLGTAAVCVFVLVKLKEDKE
jgi:vacuolar-type H+-ATPase subunit B/Vma2